MSLTSREEHASLTCITGPMFSGKTTKLIETIASYPKEDVLCLKPRIDNRYKPEMICTHNGQCIQATPISQIEDALEKTQGYKVVAIDEVQFFGDKLVDSVKELLRRGYKVILSGLEKDYLHCRFGALELLEVEADLYHRLTGTCETCNKPSTHTFRLNNNNSQILVGESNEYTALCKSCFEIKMES